MGILGNGRSPKTGHIPYLGIILAVILFGLVLSAVYTHLEVAALAGQARYVPSSMPSTIPPIGGLDLIEKVDSLYNKALVLLITLAISVTALVGVVVPIVLERLQRDTLKDTRNELVAQMDSSRLRLERGLSHSRTELVDEINSARKDLRSEIDQTADQALRRLNGYSAIHWYELARAILNTQGEAWPFAIRYWSYAINSALEAKWEPEHPWWGKFVTCLGAWGESQVARYMEKDSDCSVQNSPDWSIRPTCHGRRKTPSRWPRWPWRQAARLCRTIHVPRVLTSSPSRNCSPCWC